jgi:hypothetical protein
MLNDLPMVGESPPESGEVSVADESLVTLCELRHDGIDLLCANRDERKLLVNFLELLDSSLLVTLLQVNLGEAVRLVPLRLGPVDQ